jgi:hypothetical protein
MRKTILGTTALVAVSMMGAGYASASEKIKLGVGGYMQSTYYYLDTDDNTMKNVGTAAEDFNRTPDRFTHEGEIFSAAKRRSTMA